MEAAQNLSSPLMQYARGDEVEVVMTEDKLLGSYYHGIIIANESQQPEVDTVLYTFRCEHDNETPLREKIPVTKLRPIPPTLTTDSFMFYKNVDVYENNGWLAGKIIGKNVFRYTMYFPDRNHTATYYSFQFRVHMDYQNGSWILPLPA